MPLVGRPPKCVCGDCYRCTRRVAERLKYQSLSESDRRARVARRNMDKARAADLARYERDKPRRRAASDQYNTEHVAEVAAAKVRWAERNPKKRAAHKAVQAALRNGLLQRGVCEMAGPNCSSSIHAHHEDYDQPLEVRWLCSTHHAALHVEARRAA